MSGEGYPYPAQGEPWDDEDRTALASEGDAFRRGLSAAVRALEHQTFYGAKAAVDVVRGLLEACTPPDHEPV